MTDEPAKPAKPGAQGPRGLGRGLSALLDDDDDDLAALDRLRTSKQVPVEHLVPNRLQPRRRFDDEAMQRLVESVRAKGVLQPILVRRQAERANEYEIIAGERRWRAAQLAQLHDVPVIIKDSDDSEALELALIENVQRADLNPIEEARGYRRLLDQFGYSQERIAESIGKSRPHVANTLRLLGLPDEVQAMIVAGELTAGHGRTLLGREDAAARARAIVRQGLNVREAEALAATPAARIAETGPSRQTSPGMAGPGMADPDTRALEGQLAAALGLKVSIRHRGERGSMRIAFQSLDQFEDLCRRLMRAPEVDDDERAVG